MDKKLILVLNEGYSDNLGDQAINESIHFLLKSNNIHNIVFHDFSKKLDQPMKIASIENIQNKNVSNIFLLLRLLPVKLRWLILNFTRILKVSRKKYDHVIIGGGQLVLSNDTFSFAMFIWVLLLKIYGNNNITILGVGLGDKFNFLDKLLFKCSLRFVTRIYLRDKESQLTLEKIFKLDSGFIYDLAFIHNKINFESVEENEYSSLLGVISYDVYKKYAKDEPLSKYDFYETWISLLSESNVSLKDVKLFYTTEDDKKASLEFINYVNHKYSIKLEMLDTDQLDVLVTIISKSELVISARMHALILAITHNKDIVVYPVSEKLIEFKNMIESNISLEFMQDEIENKFKKIIEEEYFEK
ncbi:hypothetical protein OA92_03260 [Marinomonas sp. SBI22]|uniref:polysaccharide pyruvyl transferase family protein n=1 Tax=unclassified Marinomonas TaxID=196814 RepID=UPI0007AF5739|nr:MULTISPECIES: polysaccharide pyruvyl transferase family protein [unclassified Marinomonas]KZM44897.1 hypothetical protein OA92_03260 [Marinomonas sp. SBI22]KZM46596.1 hypothetical protein OA91_02320 [Marinomonas sp. SBI8L]